MKTFEVVDTVVGAQILEALLWRQVQQQQGLMRSAVPQRG